MIALLIDFLTHVSKHLYEIEFRI